MSGVVQEQRQKFFDTLGFKPYPVYKDSGVEWLGEIPEQWNVIRAKYILNEINERSKTGSESLLSVSEYHGVKRRYDVIEKGEFLTRAESLVDYKKCEPNDLVMNIMLAWKRGLGVTKWEGIVSPSYAVFRFKSEQCEPRYYHYLLRDDIYTSEFKRSSTGIVDSRLRLYPYYFLRISTLLPPLPEQQTIANFLDSETSKIDKLIDKKQRLVELLEEKRSALISHTVTKGLDPDVPMKGSGVEWLDEIPEHWDTKKIKHLVDLINNKNRIHDNNIIALEDIESHKGRLIEDINNKDYGGLKSFYEGDVLFNKLRPYLAKVYHCKTNGMCVDELFVLRSKEILIPEFLFYRLLSEDFINVVDSSTYGTKMPRTSWDFIGNIPIPIPTLKEQQQIADYLSQKTSKIDELVDKINQQVEYLKEYRTALISAAVTGKIDVRGEEQK